MVFALAVYTVYVAAQFVEILFRSHMHMGIVHQHHYPSYGENNIRYPS